MADYSMANWWQSQQQRPYSFANWNTPVAAPVATPSGMLPNNGADWEQMPMGTNGLAPNQGMFAGSAVNAPIASAFTPSGPSTVAAPGFVQSLRDWGVIDSIDPQTNQRIGGWGGLALGAAQGMGSLYLGMQQYNLAKDSLANSKSQFERNFAAQRNTINSAMEDRQNRRNAERGDQMATADYMSKYGVK